MGYKYFICDVFTTEKFAGNQLAVFPEAEGLSESEMQQIAREFNFSETTFVSPPPERSDKESANIHTHDGDPICGTPEHWDSIHLGSGRCIWRFRSVHPGRF